MNERLKIEVMRMTGWDGSGSEPPPLPEPNLEWAGRWGNLTDACVEFIEAVLPSSWDAEDVGLILHVLSNDDEWRSVIEPLVGMPDRAVALARAAVDSSEHTAKSQLADVLGCYAGDAEAEGVLLTLMADEDEYVRRVTMMSLARLGSATVPDLVEVAWASGNEYQRMACLFSLFVTESPLLEQYLGRAERKGSEHLLRMVRRMRSREGEWGLPLSRTRSRPAFRFGPVEEMG